ncbi:MAG: major capsid protein [Roseburia sp.]|nr:major capsid protein [Roseburia sp.]
MNKQLFDNVIYERFLDWDVPTIGLDFEEIIGKYNITVAAATIGDNSNEPIIGSTGLETLKESILSHALTVPMTTPTYRKIVAMLDSKSLGDDAKKQALIKLMWGDVNTVVNAIHGKLDMIFLGALSNEGVFNLDEETNPEGGARGSINFNQPGENIAVVTDSWNDENRDTVDCFEDIQKLLDVAQNKTVLAKILCAPSVISYICRTKKMGQLIWGNDRASKPVLMRDLNEFMQTNGFPVFEPIRRTVMIQNGTSAKPYTPWNADNMVFVPDGKLGVVKNAFADAELKPEPGVAYSTHNRILVSQWGAGATTNSRGVEFTKAESMSLPVITEMNGIYTLKTQKA